MNQKCYLPKINAQRTQGYVTVLVCGAFLTNYTGVGRNLYSLDDKATNNSWFEMSLQHIDITSNVDVERPACCATVSSIYSKFAAFETLVTLRNGRTRSHGVSVCSPCAAATAKPCTRKRFQLHCAAKLHSDSRAVRQSLRE